jgi:ketosteroid isomerase-like protein
MLFTVACLTASAQSSDSVRKEIEAAYVKALDAMRQAKSLEDLDELNRSFDTQDWHSIVPGQQPRGWAELRNYGFEGLWSPMQSAELLIETFELKGDTAVLTGHLRHVGMKGDVALIPLKEMWKRTVVGWKRQIHQKFAPGETPK